MQGVVLAYREHDASPPMPIQAGYAMDMADSGTVTVVERPAATVPASAVSVDPSKPVVFEHVHGTVGDIAKHFEHWPQGPIIEVTPDASSAPFSASMLPDDPQMFLKLLRVRTDLSVTSANGRYIVDVRR
jgi:hypothetical protein